MPISIFWKQGPCQNQKTSCQHHLNRRSKNCDGPPYPPYPTLIIPGGRWHLIATGRTIMTHVKFFLNSVLIYKQFLPKTSLTINGHIVIVDCPRATSATLPVEQQNIFFRIKTCLGCVVIRSEFFFYRNHSLFKMLALVSLQPCLTIKSAKRRFRWLHKSSFWGWRSILQNFINSSSSAWPQETNWTPKFQLAYMQVFGLVVRKNCILCIFSCEGANSWCITSTFIVFVFVCVCVCILFTIVMQSLRREVRLTQSQMSGGGRSLCLCVLDNSWSSASIWGCLLVFVLERVM